MKYATGEAHVHSDPPVSCTNALKKSGIAAYGYADTDTQDYEEDHLISLELGGSGDDPRNLWPEPHQGQYNSYLKDQVENWLHREVCSGVMSPEEAQKGIATDWRQYISYLIKTSGKEVEYRVAVSNLTEGVDAASL